MRKGLTKAHIICFALLWIGLCVMMFVIPSSSSIGEKIFIAVVSGVIITVAVVKDQNRIDRRRRRK